MHKRNRKIVSLLLALLLSVSPHWLMADSTYRGNVFIEMMLKMMELMAEVFDRDSDYDHTYPNLNSYYYPFFNPYGMQSFNPNSWQSMPQQFAWQQMMGGSQLPFGGFNSFPGTTGSPAVIPFLPGHQPKASTISPNLKYRPHWVEGKWIANDGMIFEVWQGQFKMYYRRSPSEVRGGLIRMKDKWLAIYEQTQQIVRQYEYARDNDKLVLKDTYGNMMYFRRMTNWLNPLQ